MEEGHRQSNYTYVRTPQRRERESRHEHQQQDQSCRNYHFHRKQQNCDMYATYTAKNNLGAMMLREKRYYDAANYFCQAMKCVNEKWWDHSHREETGLYDCHRLGRNRFGARLDQNQIGSSRSATSAADGTDFPSNAESPRESLRTAISYFYLLVDGENENNRDVNNSGLHECPSSDGNECNDGCLCKNHLQPSTFEFDDNCCEGTYVFRNPIIVVESDSADIVGNMFYPFVPNSGSSDGNGNSSDSRSTYSPIDSSAGRPRTTATTVIDKDDCVKLSSISAYNIALTYHMAVLDGNNHRRKETNNSCLKTKETNNTEGNDTKAKNCRRRGFAGDTESIPDARRGADLKRPSKRQRVANDNNDFKSNNNPNANTATNTRMTPFGECSCPCRKDIPNETNNSNNNGSIDRGLLCRALAYYEIAYRSLVSEQKVSFSQAMVILNNIGHIHRLIGSEENAKACFRHLLATMMYLQLTGDSQQISHWNSFLTNVIDLIIPPTFVHKKYAPAA
eukprot:jgi/Psemu1/29665/gm1.29665_g